MNRHFSGWRQPGVSVALAMAALAGGCSADVSRFNLPASVSLNDSAGSTGTLPAPTEPLQDRANLMGAENSSGEAYYPPQQPNRDPGVRMSALPEPAPSTYSAPAARTYSPPPASNYPPPAAPNRPYAAVPQAPAAAQPAWPVQARAPVQPAPAAPDQPSFGAAAAAQGDVIEVRPGDTLFGLSKRHHVSLTELMAANDLKGPNLKPGQKLNMPAGSARAPAPVTDAKPAATDVAVMPVEAPADWNGSYAVRPGESLYGISRQYKVKLADLQRYNAIQDVRRVKPGMVLKVPGGAGTQVATETSTQADTAPAPAVADPAAPRVVQAPAQPTILNSQRPAPADANGRQVVAINTPNSATNAAPANGAPGSGSAANSKLRWPAQGKVIAGFGQRPDGTHNDGVNLAVPMGTEVHAAETGVVAYAGNELKGYGNLILLRHDNGWVTAYAHSEELLVKRGDKIKRGQVIAKAGKTGQVDQPQVHFELRQGQRPVDPTPFMEKL